MGIGPRVEEVRTALSARLRARRPEIEQVALTRVYAVSDPTQTADPEYVEGLRRAVCAALEYGLAGIEHGERRASPTPPLLLDQARLAARNGISLDTVLRRYFAGYTLLGDFVNVEVDGDPGLQGRALSCLLREQAALFDRLLADISEEHTREAASRPTTSQQRRAELVQRLLAGDLVDATELDHDFEGHHLGVIAKGPGAAVAIRDLARSLDQRLLLVEREEGVVWGWFSGRRMRDSAKLKRASRTALPAQVSLAIGEIAQGLAGWRLTHRQARAAFSIVQRRSERLVCYADVALLASLLQDDLLATSLQELYLRPLESERDHGEGLRDALRAYFASDRKVSAAAAALGVSRNTIATRLRAVEDKLDRPLVSCAAELEVALRMEALGGQEPVPSLGESTQTARHPEHIANAPPAAQ